MIEAVSRIGDWVQNTSSSGDLLSTFIENPNGNGKYKSVLRIILTRGDGEYTYSRTDMEEFDEFQRYLYKKGAPNGTDATPTSKIAGSLDKTFQNRFLKWFENYEDYDVTDEERGTLKRMCTAIKDSSDKILADLHEQFSLKNSKDNAIITLGIEEEGGVKHLAEIQVFKNILLRRGKDKYFTKKSLGDSLGKDAVCSICKEAKDEVYGYAIPWTFHTFDKPGFIAGGFDASQSWKNTPVCFDCATRLELGKKYVEENLDFSFYGFRYLLVPKLAFGGDCNSVLEILGDKNERRKLKLNREVKISITSDEDEILDLVKEQKDSFSNSLVFYKKEQSSYRILLLIDGVLPSRLKTLFNAKERVDERFRRYNEVLLSESQREKIPLKFNFGVLRKFFPAESKNRTFDKAFLEIVNKVFVGNSIDRHMLMASIMRQVRSAFVGGYPTNIPSLNGFLLLHFLKELDLLDDIKREMTNMSERDEDAVTSVDMSLPVDERVLKFFDANRPFFSSDAKKAVFLEGVLAQKLLNIQYADKKATPFRTKLHGLKINETLAKRLLPDMENKLEEYGKNYYRALEFLIAGYFVSAGENWKEGDDDISFCFVLGMNMHKLFGSPKEEDIGNGEEA